MKGLSTFCRALRSDFWLLGEIVHGDYRRWAAPGILDSVTNYECYKGLYSSHVDENYFEIAWSLNRQFGPAGLYRGIPLYNFADNDDVSRAASSVKEAAQLVPLYTILFTMPGIPSIYYGSEWGIPGKKDATDGAQRPRLSLPDAAGLGVLPGLSAIITRLSDIRRRSAALSRGDYRQLLVAPRQLAFMRRTDLERVIVAVNNDRSSASIVIDVSPLHDCALRDHLTRDAARAYGPEIAAQPAPAIRGHPDDCCAPGLTISPRALPDVPGRR